MSLPFQGPAVEALLRHAQPYPVRQRIVSTYEALDQLLAAVEIEANGFLRVESEEAGRDLLTPKRGGTAARLTIIACQITKHLA